MKIQSLFKKLFYRKKWNSLDKILPVSDESNTEESSLVFENGITETKGLSLNEVKPIISELLLNEIKTWELKEIPTTLYHGCHIQDHGIDLEKNEICGNKWLSKDPFYAASYAWHFSRPCKPSSNSRYCVKVEIHKNNFKAIARPKYINSFPEFLAKCFSDIPRGYGLSHNFQNTLKAHLDIVFGENSNVIGYYWPSNDDSGNDEICIPNCNQYIQSIVFMPLPEDRSLLEDWRLNLQDNAHQNLDMVKSNILTLYHATRNRFDVFAPSFYKTGEGDADYQGWYFCRTLKSALWHCESYLRCDIRNDGGYILECEIESQFADEDIEGYFTEPRYDRPIYGVSLANSTKIKIVRVLSTR